MRTFLLLLGGGITYYLIALLGMSIFSLHPSNITLLWFPFGIGVILVHHFGIKALPFIFLGSFFANFSGMVNEETNYLLHLSISAFADTLAPFLSTLFIKRYVEKDCNSVKFLLPFTLYGVLIPTFISGIIISLNLYVGDYIRYDEIYSFIAILMFADGLGLFLLFPIYKHLNTLSLPTYTEWIRILFYAITTSTFTFFSVHHHYLIFMVLPLLLIAAFRIRTNILMILLLMIVVETIALSAAGHCSIFNMETEIESILMLITYLISLVFVVIGASLHHNELMANVHLTYTDNLTQTNNLKAYKERINELLALYERYQIPFSIILFDIDDFKIINDTYGHRVGDIVLTDMCSLIQNNIRSTDSLFRVGGEEFVILCPNTDINDSKEIAYKIRTIVENNLTTIENKSITISIGVSEVQIKDTEDSIYRRVDELLYQSKHSGKNTVSFEY